jgi:hypothetical protein
MEHLEAVAAILRKQLDEIELKIAELNPKHHLTEMRDTAAGWYECEAWKKFVLKKYGVIDNIVYILDDCYDAFIENSETDALPIIGKNKTRKWRKFQLKVIKELINPSKMDDDFEDTAGGCDEITSDKGFEIIEALS